MHDDKSITGYPADSPFGFFTEFIRLICPCVGLPIWRDRRRVGLDESSSTGIIQDKNGELNPLTFSRNSNFHSKRYPKRSILKFTTQKESLGNSVESLNRFPPHSQTGCTSFNVRQVEASSNTSLPSKGEADTHSGSGCPNSSISKIYNRNRTKGVSFDRVDVRRYGVRPSDNPSVPFGPALGIGWEFEVEESVSVDKFEKDMKSPSLGKGERHEMKTTLADRMDILRRAGCQDHEIRASSIQCSQERTLRERTAKENQEAIAEGRIDDYDERNNKASLVSRLLDGLSSLCSVAELP